MRFRESNIKPFSQLPALEFVSYDGKYPNLCSGILKIRVNDKLYVFENHSLGSGGRAYFSNNYANSHVEAGDWTITDWPEDFPKDSKIREEVVEMVNCHITHGCCGGCL